MPAPSTQHGQKTRGILESKRKKLGFIRHFDA
jgi:hypothetical protein